jgi:hypothetical protein
MCSMIGGSMLMDFFDVRKVKKNPNLKIVLNTIYYIEPICKLKILTKWNK